MIDSAEKLAAFLPALRSSSWVAVDTEADSLHAYPEKVCLIQISTAAGDELVDPLAGFDLGPMLDSLARHELIMHGADYDLRLLRKHHEFVPQTIFDTMLAARLLGRRQFGLSNLVEDYLQVKLEKGAQKANWALRPLTPRMERYALNDTHYLRPLEEKLKAELTACGRLQWHQESCCRLISDSSESHPVDRESVWRVKGSHALTRRGLEVLRQLWHWRESEALRAGRPPYFVLSHELLVGISEAAASDRPVEVLLPRHLSERRRVGLIQTVHRALETAPEFHPKLLRSDGRRQTEAQRRRFLELQRVRDAQAGRLELDPTLIASRAVLSELANDWGKHIGNLMTWQQELLKEGAAAGHGPKA